MGHNPILKQEWPQCDLKCVLFATTTKKYCFDIHLPNICRKEKAWPHLTWYTVWLPEWTSTEHLELLFPPVTNHLDSQATGTHPPLLLWWMSHLACGPLIYSWLQQSPPRGGGGGSEPSSLWWKAVHLGHVGIICPLGDACFLGREQRVQVLILTLMVRSCHVGKMVKRRRSLIR